MTSNTIFPRVLAAAMLTIGLTGLTPTSAGAQLLKICGDVDADGTVSVTDGVQVLRSAASLPSSCTSESCDVDQDGSIGVTDGVLVLRKAAALPVTDNCFERTPGSPDRQVVHLIQRTEPFVTQVLRALVEHRAERVDQEIPCDNRADGLLSLSFSDNQLLASFDECLIDNTFVNGDAENAGDDPLVSIEVRDNRTEETVQLDGQLRSAPLEDGLKYSGSLEASPTFDAFETGDFFLAISSLSIRDGIAFPIGSITYQLVADSNVPSATRIQIFFDGSNLARVQVEETDGGAATYGYDLNFHRIA